MRSRMTLTEQLWTFGTMKTEDGWGLIHHGCWSNFLHSIPRKLFYKETEVVVFSKNDLVASLSYIYNCDKESMSARYVQFQYVVCKESLYMFVLMYHYILYYMFYYIFHSTFCYYLLYVILALAILYYCIYIYIYYIFSLCCFIISNYIMTYHIILHKISV